MTNPASIPLGRLTRAVISTPAVANTETVATIRTALRECVKLSDPATSVYAAFVAQPQEAIVKFYTQELAKLTEPKKVAPKPEFSKLAAAVGTVTPLRKINFTPEVLAEIQRLISTHTQEVAALNARISGAAGASSKLVQILSNL